MRRQAGSVMVESLIASLAISTLVAGGSLVTYVIFARVWIERQAYEALVCLGSLANEFECEREFRFRVETALPFGEASRVRLKRSSRRATISASFRLAGKEIAHADDSRTLPLKASGR